MKAILIAAALVGGFIAAPTLAFAADGQGLARAQVRAQMQQLADAGYRGHGDETSYSADVQAARQRVRQTNPQSAPADTNGYGSQPGTRSESGARGPKGPGSLYFGA